MASVTVRVVDDPREVQHLAGGWLADHVIGANVLVTLMDRDRQRAAAGEPTGARWAVAVAGGEVVLLGRHAPGRPAQIAGAGTGVRDTERRDADAAAAVTDAWLDDGRTLEGVAGPVGTAAAAARAWEQRTHGSATLAMREGLHVLDVLEPPFGVPGRARPVRPDEVDLVARWVRDFAAEAVPHQPPLDADAARTMVEQGDYLLWDDGGPVSTAAFRTAAGVGRVGPVWTPPDRRRHGYGAAVTTTVTQRILAADAVPVLFTDLANMTSNALYRRLGYQMVAEYAEWTFDGR